MGAARRNQPEPLVKIKVPARLITKEATNSDKLRAILDKAFRVCLGRCKWEGDHIITGSVEQWGVFSYLIATSGVNYSMSSFEPEMFIPLPPSQQPSVHDAHLQGSKNLGLPKMAAPLPTPVEYS